MGTLGGQTVEIKKAGNTVSVNQEKVTTADVTASNGVVHIINAVLMPPSPTPTQNIVQLAEHTAGLDILVSAVVAADLADTLASASKKFTVFAPTDKAFKSLPAGVLGSLMKPENKKKLVDILTYHVLPEEVLSKDLKSFQAVKTVEGKLLHITKFGNAVRVGASLESKDLRDVIKADNLASNGVVHIIDGVLLPPTSVPLQAMSTILPACPKSIFDGFCHPWDLQDGGVACVRDTSSSAKITKPSDVQCVPKRNGGAAYHCPSWVPEMCQPVFDGKNIVELAKATPDLSTLTAALVAGKLTGALSGTGPFTVFAPTNEAFAKLPKETLQHLLEPKNIKELDAILEYHVISGAAVFKDDLKAEQKVKTLEGQTVEIKKAGNTVSVNQAKVTTADVTASNGVVHIIDAVLMPPPSKPTQNI